MAWTWAHASTAARTSSSWRSDRLSIRRLGVVVVLMAPIYDKPVGLKSSAVDVLRTLEVLGRESEWLAVFAVLAAATGARRGELCAVRWADVDLDRRQLAIRGNVNRWREVGPTKTHQARVVPLGGLALEALALCV